MFFTPVVRVQQLSFLPSSFQSRQTLFSAEDSISLFSLFCPISPSHDSCPCNRKQSSRLLASLLSDHPSATIMTRLSVTISTVLAIFTKAVFTVALTPPANLNLGEASKLRLSTCAISWPRLTSSHSIYQRSGQDHRRRRSVVLPRQCNGKKHFS